MKAVVIVLLASVCLFGGTMADDPPVSVIFTGSNSSSGSKGGLLGCKPLSTSSVPGPMVRFQALRTGGVEYSRKLVPSGRMTFNDVVATNSSSKDIAECAKAASGKKWDAFSFVNGQCVGYKIGDAICPCTQGDFVLYLAKGAIRRPSSAKASTAAKGRAAAPPPAGYIRKIIYPAFSMTDGNFFQDERSCEEVISLMGPESPPLLHTAKGKCYVAPAFSPYPCNSCAGPATEVLFKSTNFTPIHLLSKCGETITAQLPTPDGPHATYIYSHEGLGCIPYPDPVSDAECDITVLGPAGTVRLEFAFFTNDIDESTEDCIGDELYLYHGPADESPCTKKQPLMEIIDVIGDKLTIRFQRKPAYNRNSVNRGFALTVYAS